MSDNQAYDLLDTIDSLPLELGDVDTLLTEEQRAALNQLMDAIRTRDDVAILVACDPRLPSWILSKDQKIAIAQAHWRLRSKAIMREAIHRKDERTICRWYSRQWFDAHKDFTSEEADFIYQAIAAHESDSPSPQPDPSMPIGCVSAEPGNVQPIEAWLNGDVPTTSPETEEHIRSLERAIGDLGFEVRLEDALQSDDRATILRLCRPESINKHELSRRLNERIASFLATQQ